MFAIKVNITVCVIVRILMNPYMSVFKPLIQNSLARIQTRQAGITGDYTFVTIYYSKCVTFFLNQMLDGIRLSKGSSVIF